MWFKIPVWSGKKKVLKPLLTISFYLMKNTIVFHCIKLKTRNADFCDLFTLNTQQGHLTRFVLTQNCLKDGLKADLLYFNPLHKN